MLCRLPVLAAVLISLAACGDPNEAPRVDGGGTQVDAAAADGGESATDSASDASVEDSRDDATFDAADAADDLEFDTEVEADSSTDAGADVAVDVVIDAGDVDATGSDATETDAADTDAADTDAADTDAADTDAEEVDAVSPRELDLCGGPGGVFVAPASEASVDVAWAGGDVIVRGYADCGSEERSQTLRLRSSCGGPFALTLSTPSAGASLRASAAAADVVDSNGDAVRAEGEASLDAPALLALDLDRQLAGEDTVDLIIDLACAGGASTNWSLVIDTPSTLPTPQAENGWGIDRAPAVPSPEPGCQVGDVLPNFEGLLDQNGRSDVSLGQFASDMLVIEFGAMWCAPCLELAPDLVQLSREVELDPSFGFTFVALVGQDEFFETTDASDVARWADAIEADGPVLGGAVASELQLYCDAGLLPTTLIVDPNFVIRDRLVGPSVEAVEGSVDAAWSLFRDENPAWSSPRCAGVSEPGNLCGCVDDLSAPDDDDDTVPNACDACEGRDDRMTSGDPPLPVRCIEPFTGEFEAIETATYLMQFGFDPVLDAVRSVGPDDMPPQIVVEVITEFGLGSCTITRTAIASIPALDTLGSVGTPLIAWAMDSGNSVVEHDCDELDPAEWPSDLSAALDATTWGATITNRCGIDGCVGQDDSAWLGFELPSEPTECDLLTEPCGRALVGMAPYFSSLGSVEGPDGEAFAVAVAFPIDEEFNLPPDPTPESLTEWIDALDIVAGPPRAQYQAQLLLNPAGLADVLLGLGDE